MKFHWGDTQFRGQLRFNTNGYTFNGKKTEVFTTHNVLHMYGISFGAKIFIGIMAFSDTNMEYVDGR